MVDTIGSNDSIFELVTLDDVSTLYLKRTTTVFSLSASVKSQSLSGHEIMFLVFVGEGVSTVVE